MENLVKTLATRREKAGLPGKKEVIGHIPLPVIPFFLASYSGYEGGKV
jgi:hypothetical protein